MYTFTFTAEAKRRLKKLPPQIQKRIIEKLEFYQNQESPTFFAKHLTNSDVGTYRFRIGDYRIVCDMREETIVIIDVGHRKNIYRS